jgi:hypothetical protein
LQNARNKIEGLSLLLKYKKGQQISSRKLLRTLKKAGIPPASKGDTLYNIQEQLKEATKEYYSIKKSSSELRENHLERLATTIAYKGDHKKETILKQLRLREAQRNTARKIKYLRGKLDRNSTVMVSVPLPDGTTHDITEKRQMEKAIIASNKRKFQQSFSTPFYNHPFNNLFGYLGITKSSQQALEGTFIPPANTTDHMKTFLTHMAMPTVIRENPNNMEMTFASFSRYWRKAKENISCFPSEFCFATLKASSHDDLLTVMDCIMTRIPLITGYSPMRWQRCVDVMIPKKSN